MKQTGGCAVSVVVPVYGVESFVGRCIRSLMEQTLHDVEFIIVDDASKDGSMRVVEQTLKQYPERQAQVRVLRHEHNQGLPAARNTGLRVARGEYVLHCDGDDYADATMLQEMYEFARSGNYDFVWADWNLTYAGSERRMNQPSCATPQEALRCMLGGGMKYNVWNKLVRREIYSAHGIQFPTGYGMGEDMTMMMLCAKSRTVGHLPRAYYHYVKTNVNAFSQTYSQHHLDELRYNVQRVTDFVHSCYGTALDRELAFFHLESKFPLITTGVSRERYRLWTEWYPESGRYIMANGYVPLRSRLVQWCAWQGLWWVVAAYYVVVLRGLYRLMYVR